MKESGRTRLEQIRHVLGVLLVDDDCNIVCPGLVDDRTIDPPPELLLAPSPIVDPDLDESDLFLGDLTDGSATFFLGGDPPQHRHPGLLGDGQRMSQELVVRPLTGRRHSGAEEEPGTLDLSILLRALDLDREVLGVAAGRKNRSEPVVGITLEVLDQILA